MAENLKDARTRGIIRARLNRVRLGNLGDCSSVGDGVFELRIDYDPGYRVLDYKRMARALRQNSCSTTLITADKGSNHT